MKKLLAVVGLAAVMTLGMVLPVLASEVPAKPTIERTKAWDELEITLGGVPTSVRKMVYEDCTFYLADGVTDADFAAVIELGPKPLVMNTFNGGSLYSRPAYLLWNAEKTILLVHPLFYDGNIADLEAVSVPTALPANLTGAVQPEAAPVVVSDDPEIAYMLSDEYVEAVRTEFYRLLNEHRAAHGLRELAVNKELEVYADLRAAEQRELFGHTRPDQTPAGSGWGNAHNVVNSKYAENAAGMGTLSTDPAKAAASVFALWKNSPGHNAHMLYDFRAEITMALGIFPEWDEVNKVSSGFIFATGF